MLDDLRGPAREALDREFIGADDNVLLYWGNAFVGGDPLNQIATDDTLISVDHVEQVFAVQLVGDLRGQYRLTPLCGPATRPDFPDPDRLSRGDLESAIIDFRELPPR